MKPKPFCRPFTPACPATPRPTWLSIREWPLRRCDTLDGSYLGPTTLYRGASTPAHPGEVVTLYANGFGQTTPAISCRLANSSAVTLRNESLESPLSRNLPSTAHQPGFVNATPLIVRYYGLGLPVGLSRDRLMHPRVRDNCVRGSVHRAHFGDEFFQTLPGQASFFHQPEPCVVHGPGPKSFVFAGHATGGTSCLSTRMGVGRGGRDQG
jgi:hypothetical protein